LHACAHLSESIALAKLLVRPLQRVEAAARLSVLTHAPFDLRHRFGRKLVQPIAFERDISDAALVITVH
jgi:hypothetical protein